MIKFFRNIRKTMLRDNRYKYLLYAIGEIILVVIGILIALQINNWNEDAKQNASAQIYRQKLIADLAEDTLKLREFFKEREKVKLSIANYFEFYESESQDVEILIDSSNNVFWRFFRYSPINTTYQEMKSTGSFHLLNEEERKLLIEIANEQETAQFVINKQLDECILELHKRDKYLGSDLSYHQFYEKLGAEPKREDLIQGLLHQHNFLRELIVLDEVMDQFGTEIISKSSSLIRLLKGSL